VTLHNLNNNKNKLKKLGQEYLLLKAEDPFSISSILRKLTKDHTE